MKTQGIMSLLRSLAWSWVCEGYFAPTFTRKLHHVVPWYIHGRTISITRFMGCCDLSALFFFSFFALSLFIPLSCLLFLVEHFSGRLGSEIGRGNTLEFCRLFFPRCCWRRNGYFVFLKRYSLWKQVLLLCIYIFSSAYRKIIQSRNRIVVREICGKNSNGRLGGDVILMIRRWR